MSFATGEIGVPAAAERSWWRSKINEVKDRAFEVFARDAGIKAIWENMKYRADGASRPGGGLMTAARELKAAGMDWTEVFAVEAENRRARLAAELLASEEHPTVASKVRAFVEHGGGCRATFFNYRRRLENGEGQSHRAV